MKKLKYLAQDRTKINSDEKEVTVSFALAAAFEKGFKEAFSIINEQLELEKDKLKVYPMMGERTMAIIKMQEKIRSLFKEMVENENKD